MSMSNVKSMLPAAKDLSAEALKKPLVLVIDDDASVLSSMRVLLKDQYRVEVSPNAEAGVALAGRLHPNVVILDIKMPDKDGFWAFSKIRDIDPRIPIIFNSAYQDALEAGDVNVSYKPFAYLFKAGDSGGLRSLIKTIADAVQAHKVAVESR